jgi:hypothetical protein
MNNQIYTTNGRESIFFSQGLAQQADMNCRPAGSSYFLFCPGRDVTLHG